ncbi:MAG: glycosyl transferase family 2 [uncultured bacterium]|nr:MAG: glycosyl transferase family 2 [uncultured bacterium]HBH18403.1 glycosyl transferase family 2 [Cyanobacteria bacterium UBA9579]
MNSSYDLVIAYRIYPRVSKIPIIFSDDKYKLSELCLRSFKKSLGSLKIKMIALLDNCPDSYEELFKKYFTHEELDIIKLRGIGNLETFDLQVKLLSEQNYSESVYFAEDDYFYLPDQFHILLDFLKNNEDVDFISPYDHMDYYTNKLHNHSGSVKIFGGKHWREASSTCMTFLTTKTNLLKTSDVFESYARGNKDNSLWLSLTKYHIFNPVKTLLWSCVRRTWFHSWAQNFFGKRYKLWIPVPAVGTHMESGVVSPNVDWQYHINECLKEAAELH